MSDLYQFSDFEGIPGNKILLCITPYPTTGYSYYDMDLMTETIQKLKEESIYFRGVKLFSEY